jgi:peptidyl-prolyl cis-trans isomerase C
VVIRVCVLAAALVNLPGCSDDVSDKSNYGSMFSHKSLTSEQFAQLAKIPERAETRRVEAFNTFSMRSSIADDLLRNELKENLSITRRLVDTKSRIVLDSYFEEYLKDAVTEEAIQKYFSENSELFSEKDYELSYYLIRVKSGENEQELMLKADELYKYLSVNGSESLNLKDYSAVASSESLELSTDNADPSVLTALAGVAVGEYSRPAKTKRGIQIFEVKSLKSKPVALEMVKPKIEYRLKQALKQTEYKRLTLRIKNK